MKFPALLLAASLLIAWQSVVHAAEKIRIAFPPAHPGLLTWHVAQKQGWFSTIDPEGLRLIMELNKKAGGGENAAPAQVSDGAISAA